MQRFHILSLSAMALLLGLVAVPAAAQCPPFLCYLDLGPGGGFICPNPAVYEVSDPTPVVNPDCPAGQWTSFVVKVTLPPGCTALDILVEYEDDPIDWTLNIGDSKTNNGFGGDAPGESPFGQNAEVQILDEVLTLYGAADNPDDVEELAIQHLGLRNGALHFLVRDQFLSWGQPYSAVSTPDLERLFFLPDNPTSPDNRDIYVAANQVISGTFRNGCGARRVLMTTR